MFVVPAENPERKNGEGEGVVAFGAEAIA